MSQRERDRLKVLYEVEEGHLTQKQAGWQLKLSERRVRMLLARLRKEGNGGILHRLQGRASKRKLGVAVRAKVVRLVKRESADFGPTLAAEYLAEKHGLVVSKESVGQILMEARVWKRKRRRVEEVVAAATGGRAGPAVARWCKRTRRNTTGRRDKGPCSISWPCSTTPPVVPSHFAEHNKTEENFRLLEIYLKRWGRPHDTAIRRRHNAGDCGETTAGRGYAARYFVRASGARPRAERRLALRRREGTYRECPTSYVRI